MMVSFKPIENYLRYSSFTLMQPSFVKLTQLAQCDKSTHAYMGLVIIETLVAQKANSLSRRASDLYSHGLGSTPIKVLFSG